MFFDCVRLTMPTTAEQQVFGVVHIGTRIEDADSAKSPNGHMYRIGISYQDNSVGGTQGGTVLSPCWSKGAYLSTT